MSIESTPPATKAELVPTIDTEWDRLWRTINACSPQRLTGPTDTGGWTAKDHILHLAAWENSMVYLFQGKSRHEGLGVSESDYLEGSEDDINDAIFQSTRHIDLEGAKDRFLRVHNEMLQILDSLSEEGLQLSYSHYLPDEPGRDDASPILDRAYGNTAHHFEMHRAYIERIANSG